MSALFYAGNAGRVRNRLVALVILVVLLLVAGLAVVPVLLMMSTAGLTASDETQGADASCLPTTIVGNRTVSLDQDQLTNAASIVRAGVRLEVPTRGLVIAVATAMQESTLRNLDHGHLDSVGLFQQRNAWGSVAERTTPEVSATMFYTGGRAGQPGLLDVEGWISMPLTVAAQLVQVSAFPNAYAQWEMLATSLVSSAIDQTAVGCGDPVGATLPGGAVGAMLKTALAQQGDPYVWGATGPDAFDCSGLIVYSWRQAGYRLKVRTADQMYDLATPIRAGEEKPGDLLFGSFNSHAGPGNAGHVMIVVRPGLAVQAPSAGDVVKVSRYTADGTRWRLGRLPSTALAPINPGT